MNTSSRNEIETRDPLGLRALPPLDPAGDGWAEIEAALRLGQARRRRNRNRVALLATAACVLLVSGLLLRNEPPVTTPSGQEVATVDGAAASNEQDRTLNDLIAMSQTLEGQLRNLRSGTGSIPASSAVYVAELEDLVAQVDNQISVSPDSINLWGQRVNLLLDLAQLYQQQWEREYGRMASL